MDDDKRVSGNDKPEESDKAVVINKRKESAKASTDNESSTRRPKNANDGGHRYGNFHNYYRFNPAEERMNLLKLSGDMLDFVAEHYIKAVLDDEDPPTKKAKADSHAETIAEFRYLDVGCNEGDLTMAVSEALLSAFTTKNSAPEKFRIRIHSNGLDLDPVLIKRANHKYISHLVQSTFRVANVLKDSLDNDSSTKQYFHLTSLFSTTMWIHIHGGDFGLRQVLGDLCAQTKLFLLIEPQPSKCYRSAMVRLRKMGLPELDVSTDTLRLRARIEEEIDTILNQNSFRLVDKGAASKTEDEGKATKKGKTLWNRSVLLYKRVSEDEYTKKRKSEVEVNPTEQEGVKPQL